MNSLFCFNTLIVSYVYPNRLAFHSIHAIIDGRKLELRSAVSKEAQSCVL